MTLNDIQRGKANAPRRTVLYGLPGIGKTTFGAMSERPVFVVTEDGVGDIGCDRFPLATRYADVIAALGSLYTEQHEYRTVVIDSLDWLERLIWTKVSQDRNVESIEDIPYAKGYVFALTHGERCWRMDALG